MPVAVILIYVLVVAFWGWAVWNRKKKAKRRAQLANAIRLEFVQYFADRGVHLHPQVETDGTINYFVEGRDQDKVLRITQELEQMLQSGAEIETQFIRHVASQ